jgi:DedD protein
MAKAISDEELQLKKRARRRLVGAIALVLLVVVFLPMFLDSEPKPLNQDIAIIIPPLPGPDSSSRPATAAPAGPAPSGPVVSPAKTETVPLRPAPVPVALPKAETPKPEPGPAPVQPAKTSEDFVVQLGAFSNAANAKALQRKLQENKFKAYTEVIKNPGGERTRVRVGPYDSREAAEKARQRMRSLKLVIGDPTVVRQGD